MMNGMNPFIEEWNMDYAVNDEEIDFVNQGRRKEQQRQPNRVLRPIEPIDIMIGVAPQHQHFDKRPEDDSGKIAAKEIINILAFEPKNVGWLLGRKLGVVLKTRTLSAFHIINEFDTAIEQENAEPIDSIKPQRPIPAQRFHHLPIGKNEMPIEQRNGHMKCVPWPDIIDEKLAPFAKVEGRLPIKCDLRVMRRGPISTLVAGP